MPSASRGRPSGQRSKPWADALRQAAMEAAEDGQTKLLAAARKCVAAAINGDIQAQKELGDRLDGKASQPVEHTGADGGPIETKTVADEERNAIDQLVRGYRTTEQSAADARVVEKPH